VFGTLHFVHVLSLLQPLFSAVRFTLLGRLTRGVVGGALGGGAVAIVVVTGSSESAL
jgi:hypothetical protein